MISVEEALERVLSYASVLEAEDVPILHSLGQVLAEDIVSELDIPPLDNAGMDGYAVRAADTAGASAASPRLLKVISTVIAGAVSRRGVGPGMAIRIMTGAPVPAGADAVVRFEDTDEQEKAKTAGHAVAEIGINVPAEPGLNIRRAGEDICRGTVALPKGQVIRPADVGVMASLGRSKVMAIRRPVVAVLATGNELVPIGRKLSPGKIYNSNTYSVAALVKRYGGIPRVLGIARDSEDSLTTKLRQGLDADMLITSGGVSAGDYDIVKDVLAREGEIAFWTVRMKPGKPIAFGRIKGVDKQGRPRQIPHLGLPGNPVSSMICFELFARAALMKMMGKHNFVKPTYEAVLEEPVTNAGLMRMFNRALVTRRGGRYYARLTGPQGSGILTSMSQANALAITPEDRAEMKAGETVRIIMLDWDDGPAEG